MRHKVVKIIKKFVFVLIFLLIFIFVVRYPTHVAYERDTVVSKNDQRNPTLYTSEKVDMSDAVHDDVNYTRKDTSSDVHNNVELHSVYDGHNLMDDVSISLRFPKSQGLLKHTSTHTRSETRVHMHALTH